MKEIIRIIWVFLFTYFPRKWLLSWRVDNQAVLYVGNYWQINKMIRNLQYLEKNGYEITEIAILHKGEDYTFNFSATRNWE